MIDYNIATTSIATSIIITRQFIFHISVKNKLSSDNNTGGYAGGCYVVINHIVPGKHILSYLFRNY